jgi:hypothetical protein
VSPPAVACESLSPLRREGLAGSPPRLAKPHGGPLGSDYYQCVTLGTRVGPMEGCGEMVGDGWGLPCRGVGATGGGGGLHWY